MELMGKIYDKIFKNKTLNRVCFWVLVLMIVFSVWWTYVYILKPSVLSAENSCNIISDSELNDLGYAVTGNFSCNDYSNISIQITPYYAIGSKEYQRTLKHELCHYNQYLESRLYNCSLFLGYPVKSIFNEIECNIKMYL